MTQANRTAGWWLRLALAIAGAAASLVILALAASAMLDASRSAFAMIGSMVWASFGPHLVICAALAILAGGIAAARSPKRPGKIAGLLAVLALCASLTIVLQFVRATNAAGGSINILQSLHLAPMILPAPDTSETFLTVDGLDLKAAVFRPKNQAGLAPIMLYIHGGGFIGGSHTETAADLRWFADRGWLVVSIEYRLAKPGQPTWNKAPLDVACGLAWTAANAARLGGDNKTIVLTGDSAGGNLAINLGYSIANNPGQSACGQTVPVPAAVAVLYPAVDVKLSYERGYPVPGFEPKMLMASYIGGAPQDFPERIAAITSANFISSRAPPTLIIAPENDSLVIPEGVYGFAGRARAAGVRIELVRIPFANHIFNQLAANSLGNQAGRTIRMRFLESIVQHKR